MCAKTSPNHRKVSFAAHPYIFHLNNRNDKLRIKLCLKAKKEERGKEKKRENKNICPGAREW